MGQVGDSGGPFPPGGSAICPTCFWGPRLCPACPGSPPCRLRLGYTCVCVFQAPNSPLPPTPAFLPPYCCKKMGSLPRSGLCPLPDVAGLAPREPLCLLSLSVYLRARIRMAVGAVCTSASEAHLPSPGTPPQGGAEVGCAHLPGSSPLLFQIRTGTGEPRLAGWLSEVGELGMTPAHRDTPSQVTRAAHNMVALGHAGAVAGG